MLRPTCAFVPPYVFEALLGAEDPVLVAHARATLAVDTVIRGQRRSAGTRGAMPWATGAADTPTDSGTGPQRTIYDAHGATTLPGTRVRGEGDPPTADEAVTQAYDGLGDTWELYDTAYGRDSLDGRGLPLHASVHYGARYDNAFWDGTQMVFGDGDGTIFLSFTRSIDVIGHELTHGVTQYTANLTYQNQSGALNESVSDVFGVLVKQRTLGQSADQADWLVGADLLAPSVHGVALRSMKAPGTAYDDPRLGKDPQPATMSGYVTTSSDNGGVHTNSGIPNHAFYLAATGIGGNAWETAGQIWYDVLTGPDITTGCDFATFAELTYAAAQSRFGASSAEASAVASAWEGVELPVTGAGSGGNGSTGGSAGGALRRRACPARERPGPGAPHGRVRRARHGTDRRPRGAAPPRRPLVAGAHRRGPPCGDGGGQHPSRRVLLRHRLLRPRRRAVDPRAGDAGGGPPPLRADPRGLTPTAGFSPNREVLAAVLRLLPTVSHPIGKFLRA